MGIDVTGAAVVRPVEIRGDNQCSRLPAKRKLDARTIALSASIERVLVAAGFEAAGRLRRKWPNFSAATYNRFANAIPFFCGAFAFAAMVTVPGTIMLSMIVSLPTAFRLAVAARSNPAARHKSPQPIFPETPADKLPVYSVIAPLRGEARMVDQLLSAIEAMDYPADKLDVIIAVEADCLDTRAAITARKHRIPVVVVPVSPGEPRTKPKALGVALPLARGAYTVIYDAEDRPEPSQLRAALHAFRSGGDKLACVQARLHMDSNASWHARYFTAEYAGHFDYFLPKLAAFGLPLPLGGSSNHFRTQTLRAVGGWDPYNVTEDADLGMRLARFGYRCGVIASTTHEEAPANICRWLAQRSRWFKGWMQTWLVHMRHPIQLVRDLGLNGFLTFQAVVGGNALIALAHPAFLVNAAWKLTVLKFDDNPAGAATYLTCCLATAAFGYLASAVFGWCGLRYRDAPNKLQILVWTPIHWLLLSAAAYWAALELILAPFRWRKTEHGADKAAWLASTIRPLLNLERYLTELKSKGELPQIWNDVTNSAVNRPPRPQGAS